ncbi:MAG TPA: hypothetical protein VKB05_02815 [Pyrinomonadaceae bacterium]|nr:hypothetical protein [Pyrinomonadaceae bacterium]
MKTRINDPIHNPFHNRFHDPVHSRLDEMQSFTHMALLHTPMPLNQQTKTDQHPRYWARALAGAFALVLVVILSATLLSN